MLDENIGRIARENVAKRAPAYARYRAQKDAKEVVGAEPGVDRRGRSDRRKDAQTGGVGDEHELVVNLLLAAYRALNDRKKNDNRRDNRRRPVRRIPKHHGRQLAEQHVANRAPAARRNETQDAHAENVHALLHTDHGARNSERDRPDNLQGVHKERHFVSSPVSSEPPPAPCRRRGKQWGGSER